VRREIYSVGLVDHPKGTRKILGKEAWVETSPGVWERADLFTQADVDAGIRTRVPYGPRSGPKSQMNNFVGVASGFSPTTPPLRLLLDVSGVGSDRPLKDILPGYFRSGSWTVLERAKHVLDTLHPQGFEYWPVRVELRQRGKSVGELTAWACEPIIMVEGLDAANTPRFSVALREGQLLFRSSALGSSAFFRDEAASFLLCCTSAARDAILNAGLTGLYFDRVGSQVD
jgi:hypothetical protein